MSRATLKGTTSTTEAAQEKCPQCGSEEVYTVFGGILQRFMGKPQKELDIYKRCDSCNLRWYE